jgi:hypothetical protein
MTKRINWQTWYIQPEFDERILHINFTTQHELCATMLRMQEFYESPYTNINGKFFTLKEYKTTCRDDTGIFDYYTAWSGFNIPGYIVIDFYRKFYPHYYKRELKIYAAIQNFIENYSDNFYIIATFGGADDTSTRDHELAHAMYYLESEYRDNCNDILKQMSLDDLVHVSEKILSMGYNESVLFDEIQAYLSTDSLDQLNKRFNVTPTLCVTREQYRSNFLATKKGE